jgi:hypothetical protein
VTALYGYERSYVASIPLADLVRYIAVSRPYVTIEQVLIPKEFLLEIKSFHQARKCKSVHTKG